MPNLSEATSHLNVERVQMPKIAIVGMDAFWGACNSLSTFERSIYDGTQHFIPVPPKRWCRAEDQEAGLQDEAPLGGYIQDFQLDLSHLNLSPSELNSLHPQELLMLKVADNALRNAGVCQGAKATVLMTTATTLSIDRLRKKCKVPSSFELHEYPSPTGNNQAQRIATLWNFTGTAFTLSAEENSLFKVLEAAQLLLTSGEADTVLVGAADLAGGAESVSLRSRVSLNTGTPTLSYDQYSTGWMIGEGAGAVVLKLHDVAQQQGDRIYAVIDAISLVHRPASTLDHLSAAESIALAAEAIEQACHKAFSLSGLNPKAIGYVEVQGSGIPPEDEAEIVGLLRSYRGAELGVELGAELGAELSAEPSCAIGSIKANVGHAQTASSMASLIKTALCLYYRYIPATPQWSRPKQMEAWHDSPFYVAPNSRPWFQDRALGKRAAALSSIESDGTYAHLILSETSRQINSVRPNFIQEDSQYLAQTPLYLLPIAANTCSELIEQLHILEHKLESCSCLATLASRNFADFQRQAYVLTLLGHHPSELLGEIQRALKGVVKAIETGEDWKTPAGSYFTPNPLGQRGAIAFVYPGALNSYIGLGQNLFRLFPQLHEHVSSYVSDVGLVLKEKILYPRSLTALSRRQLETLEQDLIHDSSAMLQSGIGFATLFTAVLQDHFEVRPHFAFGYSVGEISMICAQQVWSDYNKGSNALISSPLFKTRLSGAKYAVRDYWGLSAQETQEFWSISVVMAPVSQVRQCVAQEDRVYLTQINTENEVVIAGDPQACKRVIERLKCDTFSIPPTNVIHCEAMQSEYEDLVELNTLPIQNTPNVVFYSAADYEPIELDSASIGRTIAKSVCQPIDFPRLVNRVYEAGARIFIEAGAGSTCSRWISTILKHQDHVTISMDKRGVDDHTSILRALAKLVSHQVPLNLSPLYSNSPLHSNLLTDASKTQTITLKSFHQNMHVTSVTLSDQDPQHLVGILAHSSHPSLSTSQSRQYQQLAVSASQVSRGHAAFLKTRQDSLDHINKMIQIQIAVSQQMFSSDTSAQSKND